MLEKIERFQALIIGLLITVTLIISAVVVSSKLSKDEIYVTGSAYEIVKSDKGTLNFDIVVKRNTKQEAYKVVQDQIKSVENYLKDKKITNIDLRNMHGYYSYKNDPKTGYSTNETDYYNLYQPISITSDNVELIKDISNNITGLINQGIDISTDTPSYDYSKLPELKVKLLEQASRDAKQRAISILKSTHNSVGKIQAVKMGVYQITPVDSTNVSDMGINDTSTIDKKVTAVTNITFKIK
jgi:hypothetical protein